MQYVEKMTSRRSKSSGSQAPKHSPTDDDQTLAARQKSLRPDPPRATPPQATPPPKKGPAIDWFEFFLSAGCDVDDCTRYAASFERDKIDEAILPDITDATMRSLGLREGDIIRVTKAIEKRKTEDKPSDLRQEQLLRDEEYARQLQAEESGGPSRRQTNPAPNLFAGPGGALKNNAQRRGRPQPSKSLPPTTVDLSAISTVSDQIQRTSSPQLLGSPASTPSSSLMIQPPQRSSSVAAAAPNGFEDDAWTNRPSSTRPLAPTPPVATPRAPSAPPAPPAASSAPPPAQPAPSSQPVQPQTSGKSLAKTTESDIFDQLSRLSQLGANSANRSPAPPPSSASPSIASPSLSYRSGLGMGSSPVPMGNHYQNQQSGFLPQPVPPPVHGPRGPFAPVPANQSLLQPLIPTNTGFNQFVPTRPGSNISPFQNQPPMPTFLPPQPTGFPAAQPMVSHPTGIPFGGYGAGNSFQNNGFTPVQSSTS